MSNVNTYKCDINGCAALSQDAISFNFKVNVVGEFKHIYVLEFSLDPTIFPKHACNTKHFTEYFANELDKMERTVSLCSPK